MESPGVCSSSAGFFYSTSFWYNSCVLLTVVQFIHSHCCFYSFVGIDQYWFTPFPDDEHLSAIQLRLLQTALLLTFLSISSVQLLSRVRLFATPWTAARQASLSITNSQNLPKLMSIKSVMPSNHLILCHPLLLLPSIFPSIRVFSDESVFTSGGQSIGVSASASALPMDIQDWFPLG